MGKKTISVSEETYRRLERERRADEDVSDVIDRLLPGDDENPLRELVGLVDDDELGALRRRTVAFRDDVDGRLEATDDE
ncbi:antitoxin VapB family protein [Natronobeatus ordinarius]|uniref:antitoxin VapB family protein n=1 Tax=Natronobeatus ordinarius TaxID=2963433 RepID=UPI0020CE523E|nr:antitoxin VapB family protein [Natronobeatus ordinarius]